jgi:hypothetical protein
LSWHGTFQQVAKLEPDDETVVITLYHPDPKLWSAHLVRAGERDVSLGAFDRIPAAPPRQGGIAGPDEKSRGGKTEKLFRIDARGLCPANGLACDDGFHPGR